MATPRGAEHRDLEQRLRNMQAQINRLASRVLGQRQLSVTEGDFVVSGGGGVLVQDGGTISAEYDNGQVGLEFGKIRTSAAYSSGLLVYSSAGDARVKLAETLTGTWFGYITGFDFLNLSAGDLLLGDQTDTNSISLEGDTISVIPNTQLQLDINDGTGSVLVGTVCQNVQIGHQTTSSAANCFISTAGRIYRSTSSRRYKADIEDAEVDPAKVLGLRGRTWQDKADAGDPDAPRHIGFIAEELHEAGLGEFVTYDEDGPEAIAYDRLSVALLAVAQQQAEQIAGLSARLDALEQHA